MIKYTCSDWGHVVFASSYGEFPEPREVQERFIKCLECGNKLLNEPKEGSIIIKVAA